VTLAWRESPQSIVTGYRLLAGTASGQANVGAFAVGLVTSYTTQAPAGAFFVRVQAVNACGAGVPSAEAVAVVGGATVPPGAPLGLEASVTGSTVTLSWAAPSIGTGPFSYRVEAGSATGLSNLAVVNTAAPSFSTANVPAGVYYVRVRAFTAAGVGPSSNEVVVVVR
jgi:predicted phage tail protein